MLDVIGDFLDLEISEAEKLAIEAEEDFMDASSAADWSACDADEVFQ